MSEGSHTSNLDDLAARIHHAEKNAGGEEAGGGSNESGPTSPQAKGGNPAFDMLATLLGSMAFGWVVDRVLGTSPWVMIGMIPAGFGVVLVNIWRALAKTDQEAQK